MSDGWANALPCPPLATPMIIRNVLAVSKDYDAALVKREAMCESMLVAMHLSCSN